MCALDVRHPNNAIFLFFNLICYPCRRHYNHPAAEICFLTRMKSCRLTNFRSLNLITVCFPLKQVHGTTLYHKGGNHNFPQIRRVLWEGFWPTYKVSVKSKLNEADSNDSAILWSYLTAKMWNVRCIGVICEIITVVNIRLHSSEMWLRIF
jgi:hypothetical protein